MTIVMLKFNGESLLDKVQFVRMAHSHIHQVSVVVCSSQSLNAIYFLIDFDRNSAPFVCRSQSI